MVGTRPKHLTVLHTSITGASQSSKAGGKHLCTGFVPLLSNQHRYWYVAFRWTAQPGNLPGEASAI
jgi:hypothetical protein